MLAVILQGAAETKKKESVNLLLSICPTYARGENPQTYCKLNGMQAAKIVLESSK